MTDTKVSTEDKAVLLQATYLLAAGNLYVVTYKIYPSGIVHVNAKFTSTDMQAAETEVSEATRMATFTPEVMQPAKPLPSWKFPHRCTFPLTGTDE